MLKRLLAAALPLIFSACAAVPLPKELPAPGGVIETLQGGVNISLATPAGQTSGNGILIYRRPESFRLTMLAPFGQRLFDIVVNGDKVLCIADSKQKAWQGSIRDLPEWLGTRIWPLMVWVVDSPPPAGPALQRSYQRGDGTTETVYYTASGLVTRKVNAFGDEVVYSDYRKVNGVAVAQAIEIKSAEGSRLTLAFDEPEINLPVDSEVLSPPVEHYVILPLSDFKGF